MKIRLLPEIDLARIAVLPRDQRRRALRQMKLGRPRYSYAPTRQELLEIFNVEPGGLFASPRTEWTVIEASVRKNSKTLEERAANLMAAASLYGFACDHQIQGRQHDFFPLAVGTTAKVTFWSKAVLSYNRAPLVTFIDPRQSKKLTVEGRRFVFSVMHQRIRVADLDFADVALGIFQLGATVDGSRIAQLHTDEGVDLFDFDTIDEMVRETYSMWFEVLDEREAEYRRTGTGGPLFE